MAKTYKGMLSFRPHGLGAWGSGRKNLWYSRRLRNIPSQILQTPVGDAIWCCLAGCVGDRLLFFFISWFVLDLRFEFRVRALEAELEVSRSLQGK